MPVALRLVRRASRRPFRQFAAVLALLVLHAQLAVAAYACPAMAPAEPPCPHHARAAVPAPAPVDPADLGLCLEHCNYGDQVTADAVALPLPELAPVAFAAALLPLAPTRVAVARRTGSGERLRARAPPPPIAILHCCLRT